jgi:hypothetical protein
MLEAWMQMAGSHDPELRLARTSGRRRAMSGAQCRELRLAVPSLPPPRGSGPCHSAGPFAAQLEVQSPGPASQVRGASPSAARRSGLRRGCRRVASRGDRGGLRWSDPQQRLRSHAGRPGCGRLLDSLPDHVIRLGVEPARSSTPREVARWWTASASDQSNRNASPTLPPL